jgi:hypothetical protein
VPLKIAVKPRGGVFAGASARAADPRDREPAHISARVMVWFFIKLDGLAMAAKRGVKIQCGVFASLSAGLASGIEIEVPGL